MMIRRIAWLSFPFSFSVHAGPATHLAVSVPDPAVSYSNLQFSVTALDASDVIDDTYNGTVAFTASDPAFLNFGNLTLVNGAGQQNGYSLKTAGTQTVTATDVSNASISGMITVQVVPGAMTGFSVAVPAQYSQGVPFTFTVRAQDLFGNTVPTYAGTVHFTASDASATLPADSTLANGAGSFTATFNSTAAQHITATDTQNPALTGSSQDVALPVRLESLEVE